MSMMTYEDAQLWPSGGYLQFGNSEANVPIAKPRHEKRRPAKPAPLGNVIVVVTTLNGRSPSRISEV